MQNLKKRDKLEYLLITFMSLAVPAMVLYFIYKSNPNITKSINLIINLISLAIFIILLHFLFTKIII